jgi:hemerythrin-like domain-containing protein
MQLEETQFLPRAMAALTDQDWAEVDAKAAGGNDPVFGEKVEKAYLAIYERIRKVHL